MITMTTLLSRHPLPGNEILAQSQDHELGKHGQHVRIAHGVVMAVVFLCLKPAGAMMLRILPGPLGLKFHIAWQMAAWFIAFTGVGMGIWLASKMHRFGKQHPIIGFVVVAGMIVQPVMGYYHHLIFVKTQHKTVWGTVHVWLGRLIIILAIINGGIGLGDAANSLWATILYSVVAGVSFFAYITLSIFLGYRAHHTSKNNSQKEKGGENNTDEHSREALSEP